jgi:hypothetical protein
MRVRCVLLALVVGCAAAVAAEAMTLENDTAAYHITADGRTLAFRDRRSGKDYCARPGRHPILTLKKDGKTYGPTNCTYADGQLTVVFQPPGVTVVIKVAERKRAFLFEVASVSDPAVEELSLLNLRVTCSEDVSRMSGVARSEEFAVALRALNLQARGRVGGRPARLAAIAYRQYGLVGARVALVGCPADEIRPALQDVVREGEVPWSPLGGPFALDAEENRGSYVFARVSEANVDDWIALCKRAGIAEVHFHGWWESLGHYPPKKSLFPNGLEGLKQAVAKVHAAGLKAGMHTLTGCIAPNDSWVRPVPDERLAADASFALAEAVDAKATVLQTTEPPQEFDTVWAYGAHGNVVRIGEELVQFTGLSRETEPYGFTGCRRGAFGTQAAAHAKGATVDHLYVRYGCFQPDETSTLVDEVAAAIANVLNTCGFDMIYMDGAEGMPGGWHGVATMRAAIFRKLRRRCLVEASSWGCPSWPSHSRIGAWDHPKWGLKRFVDRHVRANLTVRRQTLLPAQLGWWAILGPSGYHDAERRDEIEYLCAKALAHDMPLSFQTVRVTGEPPNARQDEYLALVGRYERLRLGRAVPEAIRERLREEGQDFRLEEAPDGGWQFRPTDYAEHTVTALDDGSSRWTVTNRHAGQPVRLRIQTLYSVEPYDSDAAMPLAEFQVADELPVRRAAKGVTADFTLVKEPAKVGETSGRYTATNAETNRRGAWTRVGRRFQPHADLRKHGAVGFWIHGDGRGALLNVQLANPRQYYRTLAEHYVTVDFTGWRYVELLFRERSAADYHKYRWPYPGHYAVYRAPLVRPHVSELNLYLNDLPPKEDVTLHLSPIRALPVRKITLRNPAVTVNGQRLVFPVALESGHSIELRSAADCAHYDARGARIETVRPQGEVPRLRAGENVVEFTCQGPDDVRRRASVTLISQGEALR